MKHKGLSQEGLKLLACVTMLIDHIGATLVVRLLTTTSVDAAGHDLLYGIYNTMRLIGRIAFPIYCFLLVEGVQRTRNPKKYALRLFIGMLLSEIPFDAALSPIWLEAKWTLLTLLLGFNPEFNSVMMTLLLGFGMLQCMKRTKGVWKTVMILLFYILAELLCTDYAGMGILLIAVLELTRDIRYGKLLCVILSAVVLTSGMGADLLIGTVRIPMEAFALFAFIPIFCYDGRKLTHSKAVQWAFYLFYPAHLALLALLQWLILDFTRFR